jgi:hypothetical protein
MPEGLHITEAHAVPTSAPSIEASILAFRYQITPPDDLAAEDIDTRLSAFLGAPESPLRNHSAKGDRFVDARPFVARLERRERVIEIVILFGPRGSVKPGDLLAAILDLDRTRASRLRVRKVETIFRGAPSALLVPAAAAR